jgi:competence protein ComEC
MNQLIHPWVLYAFTSGAFISLLYLHQQSQLTNWTIYNSLTLFLLLLFLLILFFLPAICNRFFNFSDNLTEFKNDKSILNINPYEKKPKKIIIFHACHIAFAFILGFLIYQQYGQFRARIILDENIELANKINNQMQGSLLTTFQIVDLPKIHSSGGQVVIQIHQQPQKLILNWSDGFYFKNIVKNLHAHQLHQSHLSENRKINAYLAGKSYFQPIVGEVYQAKLNIKAIHSFSNPYAMDIEQNYFRQGIQYSAQIKSTTYLQKKSFELQKISLVLNYTRQKIRDILLQFFSQQKIEQSPVFLGLVLGDTSLIEADEWQVFQKTGIAHLIAISGLHITLIFYLSQFLAVPLLKFFPALCLKKTKFFYLNFFGLLISGIYTLLSGLSVPAQRTFLMLFFAKIFQQAKFSLSIRQNLSWVMLLVLLFDPWAVLSKGFLLSFLIVGLLIHFSDLHPSTEKPFVQDNWRTEQEKNQQNTKITYSKNLIFNQLQQYILRFFQLRRINSQIKVFYLKLCQLTFRFVKQQWHLNALLIPISIFIFSQLSLISPLMNILAIPLITYIVTPLALILSFLNVLLSQSNITALDGFLAKFWAVNDFLLNQLMILAKQGAAFKFAVLDLPTPSYTLLLSGFLGVAFLLLPHRARYLGILFFIPFFYKTSGIQNGEFKMTALDVGQGTAVVIQTKSQVLVFDTGGQSGSKVIAKQTLIPFLKKQGIESIDDLIISHGDLDHSAGFKSLLQSFYIKRFHTTAPRFFQVFDQSSQINNQNNHFLKINQKEMQNFFCQPKTWQIDGVVFSLLAPNTIKTAGEENSDSCVLKVFDQKQQYLSVLITADIGFAEEALLINQYQADVLKADVLLVPHHGSRFSSDLSFIQAVAPQIAISQNGFLNRYRHPHPLVESRYLSQNIYFYRSDYHGAVILHKNDLKAHRLKEKRYWSFDAENRERFK